MYDLRAFFKGYTTMTISSDSESMFITFEVSNF